MQKNETEKKRLQGVSEIIFLMNLFSRNKTVVKQDLNNEDDDKNNIAGVFTSDNKISF